MPKASDSSSVLDFISSVDLGLPQVLSEKNLCLAVFFSVITHYYYTRALLE